MDVRFAVAKISKWAAGESGDTVEMIERPHGGLSQRKGGKVNQQSGGA